jgi:hypothetical protein
MLAYVNLVQKREKEIGCDVLTHQSWSGAGYIDGILGSIQSGSSSSKSMGEGNTEAGECVLIPVKVVGDTAESVNYNRSEYTLTLFVRLLEKEHKDKFIFLKKQLFHPISDALIFLMIR